MLLIQTRNCIIQLPKRFPQVPTGTSGRVWQKIIQNNWIRLCDKQGSKLTTNWSHMRLPVDFWLCTEKLMCSHTSMPRTPRDSVTDWLIDFSSAYLPVHTNIFGSIRQEIRSFRRKKRNVNADKTQPGIKWYIIVVWWQTSLVYDPCERGTFFNLLQLNLSKGEI